MGEGEYQTIRKREVKGNANYKQMLALTFWKTLMGGHSRKVCQIWEKNGQEESLLSLNLLRTQELLHRKGYVKYRLQLDGVWCSTMSFIPKFISISTDKQGMNIDGAM